MSQDFGDKAADQGNFQKMDFGNTNKSKAYTILHDKSSVSSACCDSGKSVRHCSFCLQVCSSIKLCGNCRKRAYCCRECQAADWHPLSKGQGHKNWCKYECGEEDVDWDVRDVPGKGLGVIAKRAIPAGYRIIVEPVFTDPSGHPAIEDLMPEKGTLSEKFELNAFASEAGSVVSLRICRVNHNCDANAAIFYCCASKVKILYAQREIRIGEEICISYELLSEIFYELSLTLADIAILRRRGKERLVKKWGIICNADCLCNSERANKLIRQAIELAKEVEMMEMGLCFPSLQPVQDLLLVLDSIPLGQYSLCRGNLYYYSCKLIIRILGPFSARTNRSSKSDLNDLAAKSDRARDCANMAYNIFFAISPFSDCTKRLKSGMACSSDQNNGQP